MNNNLNFISISYQASSLYNLIADGSYRSTNIGRTKWLSLVKGSGLQPYCDREGFNVYAPHSLIAQPQVARIGIIGNEDGDRQCHSPDSYFGFGGLSKHKRIHCGMPKTSNTCGNAAYCGSSGGNREIPAMGYIFVR